MPKAPPTVRDNERSAEAAALAAVNNVVGIEGGNSLVEGRLL